MLYNKHCRLSSGNAVWEDAESAFRALHGLTCQPVAQRSEFVEDSMETEETTLDEVCVKWRLGVECPKAKQLLLRYAVTGDKKVSGAAQHSKYYMKYGRPKESITKNTSTGAEGVGEEPTAVSTEIEQPAGKDLR